MQGALGAGEEAWRIREAVAECRRGRRERGRDGWILGRIGRERAWVENVARSKVGNENRIIQAFASAGNK